MTQQEANSSMKFLRALLNIPIINHPPESIFKSAGRHVWPRIESSLQFTATLQVLTYGEHQGRLLFRFVTTDDTTFVMVHRRITGELIAVASQLTMLDVPTGDVWRYS